MPDFSHEAALGGRVAGVDEVGRGPLAGPVIAAAVVLDPSQLPAELLDAIDDSKRLKAERRTAIAQALMHHARAGRGVEAAIAGASSTEIARLNILQATFLAMRRAVARLPRAPDRLLIDGKAVPPAMPCPVTMLVGGDGKALSIAAASILAKVLRDGLMERLDRRYPDYGWARNAGYGTAEHRAAIVRIGATPHHRLGFGPLLTAIN
jgi:ribonuclease HII